MVTSNNWSTPFPGDSALFMGAMVADLLDHSNIPRYLRGLTVPDLAVMAEHIVACKY